MKYIVGFVRFWYDFIIGDDWRVAPDGSDSVYFRRETGNGAWRWVSSTASQAS